MADIALNNASSITLHASGVNVSESVSCKRTTFLVPVFNLTVDYTFAHFNVFGENYK